MKAAYHQKGESLDYINQTDAKIEAGEVVTLGGRIGIAGTDINAGELGSVHVEGVYAFTKKDKAELAMGTDVYLAQDGITTEASAGTGDKAVQHVKAGFVVAYSPASSTEVFVKINA